MTPAPLLAPLSAAVIERATLFFNHVLGSEPTALERLRPHAGKVLRLDLAHWPRLLPAWPELVFEVTPAGMVEWQGRSPVASAPALLLTVDASNPALLAVRGLAGERPPVEVQGDAAFAGDVSWLIDNLRWDARDDLARLVGPAAAQAVGSVGRVFADGLREALRLASSLASRGTKPGAG